VLKKFEKIALFKLVLGTLPVIEEVEIFDTYWL
jgi:hypothetical protein